MLFIEAMIILKEYFSQDSIDSIYDAIKTVDVHLKNITLVMKNM